ncbi:glutaredoxin [Salipaludibacillus sp. HK11]|uniref:glutaredoxin n=1 Tax=Salipaludibacillus sp. HK11 TaxID=3394320 RepID=UPI0039FC65FC
MAAKIEVFTQNLNSDYLLIEEVKATACSECEMMIYHEGENNEFAEKVDLYSIQLLPSVVINGRIVDHNKLIKAKK